MSPESSNPIFIHSLWRAGSTYLFQVFRRSEVGYYCYQEPLHEIALFNKDIPEKLLEFSGDIMRPLRHPELSKPYFQELYDIFPAWQPYIQKSDIYDAYFSHECSETVSLFFKSLIEHAQGRAVIQECRTSNRIGALKKYFSGTHIYLWRNPWDQWWSYKATDYFDMIQLLVINAVDVPPVVKALRKLLHFNEFHSDLLEEEMTYFNASRLSSEDSYCCFYLLWCLTILEAQKHADLTVNIDQLSMSGDYRKKILRSAAESGVSGLDFSDCHIHCTQFTNQDASFFISLEEKVYGLLLSHAIGLEQIDFIREIRRQNLPEQQKALPENTAGNGILEDAKRTREIAVRLTNALHRHTVHQLNLQHQLEQQHKAELNQQVINAEQQCAELQRLFDEQREHLMLQHAVEQDTFKSLLSQQQEKTKAEAQLRLEDIATREKEYNEQLAALRSTTELEKSELRNQFLERLATAEQIHAAREEELLQELLAMQACSAEREKIFNDQTQTRYQEAAVIEAQLRQELLQKEQQAHCLRFALEQVSAELRLIHASFSWWLTAPLRLFNPLSTTTKFSITSESITYQSLPQVCTSLVPKDTNMNSNTQSDATIIPAKTVDELLRNFDVAFVHGVYVTLLGREPDPEGMSYYLARLRSGYGKAELVAQIALSKEGRSRKIKILGLEDLLVQQQRTNHWFWRFFNRGRRLECQCNRLEYALDNVVNRLNGVELSVNEMSRSIEVFKNMSALSQSEAALEIKPNSDGTTVSEASDKEASEQELENLSASAKKIYAKLLEARKGNEG